MRQENTKLTMKINYH